MSTSSRDPASYLLRPHNNSSSSNLREGPGHQQNSLVATHMDPHRSTKAWIQWPHQAHHHKAHCHKLPTSTSLLLQTMCRLTCLQSTQSIRKWAACTSVKNHRQRTRASPTHLQTTHRTIPMRRASSQPHRAYRCKIQTRAIPPSQTMCASKPVPRNLQQSSRQRLPRVSSSRMSNPFSSQVTHQVQLLGQAQHHHLHYLKAG
jgi:hypothetical protein